MSGEGKRMKVVFEEGAFDDFEGTQEELDELIAEITRMAESGELFDKGVPIEELDDESLPNEVRRWLDNSDPQPMDRKSKLH